MNNLEELEFFRTVIKAFRVDEGVRCVYCGNIAQEKEHVTPKNFLNGLVGLGNFQNTVKYHKSMIVPACKECNLIASGQKFRNFTEKKKFIKEKLKNRYRKILLTPFWTDTELLELDFRLREYVLVALEAKRVVQARLNF